MFLFWLESKFKNTANNLKNTTDNNYIALTETSICFDRVHKVGFTNNTTMMALTMLRYRMKNL